MRKKRSMLVPVQYVDKLLLYKAKSLDSSIGCFTPEGFLRLYPFMKLGLSVRNIRGFGCRTCTVLFDLIEEHAPIEDIVEWRTRMLREMESGCVIEYHRSAFERFKKPLTKRPFIIKSDHLDFLTPDKKRLQIEDWAKKKGLNGRLFVILMEEWLGERLPLPVTDSVSGETIIKCNQKITQRMILEIVRRSDRVVTGGKTNDWLQRAIDKTK
jgi:hypothetical protein